MTVEREYPRWVHCPGTIPGKKSALVNWPEAEEAQLAAWSAESGSAVVDPPSNPLMPPAVVAAVAPASVDVPALRKAYEEKFGKRAFPGWGADELNKRMAG